VPAPAPARIGPGPDQHRCQLQLQLQLQLQDKNKARTQPGQARPGQAKSPQVIDTDTHLPHSSHGTFWLGAFRPASRSEANPRRGYLKFDIKRRLDAHPSIHIRTAAVGLHWRPPRRIIEPCLCLCGCSLWHPFLCLDAFPGQPSILLYLDVNFNLNLDLNLQDHQRHPSGLVCVAKPNLPPSRWWLDIVPSKHWLLLVFITHLSSPSKTAAPQKPRGSQQATRSRLTSPHHQQTRNQSRRGITAEKKQKKKIEDQSKQTEPKLSASLVHPCQNTPGAVQHQRAASRPCRSL
jgi:hypothetical protein